MNKININLLRIPTSVISVISRLIDQVGDNMVELSTLSVNHEYIHVNRHFQHAHDDNVRQFPIQQSRELVRIEVSSAYRNASNDETRS